MKSHFDKLTGKMRETSQRSESLEQHARQPRLLTEADVPTDTKTHKRTEGAAADHVKHGDSCSANQVDPDQMCPTSFGDDSTRLPASSC